eukprot:4693124-Lingulodinium_polyedra.AAC.1
MHAQAPCTVSPLSTPPLSKKMATHCEDCRAAMRALRRGAGSAAGRGRAPGRRVPTGTLCKARLGAAARSEPSRTAS